MSPSDPTTAAADAIRAKLAGAKPKGPAPPPRRPLEHITFADAAPLLDGRPLIAGILEREQISVVYGHPGCGKSYWALDLGIRIAAGMDCNGCRVQQGAVIYIAIEAGKSIANRIYAFKQHHRLEGENIPFAAITSPVDLCHAKVGDVPRLIEKINGIFDEPVVLVIVDTLNRALAGGDENSSVDMGALVASMDKLRDALHCHVLAIHHCGKEEARGSRGHSCLKGNVDTEIKMERRGDLRIVTVDKQRDGPDGMQTAFKLFVIELGRNQDGNPVTSCVVIPEQVPAAEQTLPFSDQVNHAFRLLKKAITENGIEGWVRIDSWSQACANSCGFVKPGSKDSTFRSAFSRARQKLQEYKYIRERNEHVALYQPEI